MAEKSREEAVTALANLGRNALSEPICYLLNSVICRQDNGYGLFLVSKVSEQHFLVEILDAWPRAFQGESISAPSNATMRNSYVHQPEIFSLRHARQMRSAHCPHFRHDFPLA